MARYSVILLILMSVFVSVSAQDTAYTSEDGTLHLTVPEGWNVGEDKGDGYFYVGFSRGDDAVQLEVFDLLENQCTDIAFEDPMRGDEPYLPCKGGYDSVLEYGVQALWPTSDPADLIYHKINATSGCVEDRFYIACVKDVGYYKFLILLTYTQFPGELSEEEYSKMLLDMSMFVIESATYGKAPSVTTDAFPQPVATENGWTLDLSTFKLGNYPRFVLGGDGLFYLATDGKIVVITPDGTVDHVLENDYLLTILDLTVTPDGAVWVLNGYSTVYQFSPEGEFIGESGSSHPAPIQIESTPDGKLVFFTMADMASSVNVEIRDPDGSIESTFSVLDEKTFGFVGTAEAWLSMSKLGAGSSDEIYVFSEMDNIIRGFDSTGKVIVPSLADEFAYLGGFSDHFGFTDKGIVDVYASGSLVRVTLADKTFERFTLPSEISLLLPDDEIVYYLDGTLVRDVWTPIPIEK